jgi:hypothetical protein
VGRAQGVRGRVHAGVVRVFADCAPGGALPHLHQPTQGPEPLGPHGRLPGSQKTFFFRNVFLVKSPFLGRGKWQFLIQKKLIFSAVNLFQILVIKILDPDQYSV